jgi:hypothetical protein
MRVQYLLPIALFLEAHHIAIESGHLAMSHAFKVWLDLSGRGLAMPGVVEKEAIISSELLHFIRQLVDKSILSRIGVDPQFNVCFGYAKPLQKNIAKTMRVRNRMLNRLDGALLLCFDRDDHRVGVSHDSAPQNLRWSAASTRLT